jgi:hypothetical protein
MISIVSEGETSISRDTPSLFAKRNLILTVSLSVGVLLIVSLSIVMSYLLFSVVYKLWIVVCAMYMKDGNNSNENSNLDEYLKTSSRSCFSLTCLLSINTLFCVEVGVVRRWTLAVLLAREYNV